MSDLNQQPGETVEAYAQRMLAIIRILHGRVQIAAGRSYDMDDVIDELQAIVDGDGEALAVIDLQRAVVALREYSTDEEVMDTVREILGFAALDRGEGVDFDEMIKKAREIVARKRD